MNTKRHSRLFFDRNDYELLRIVNDVLDRRSRPQTMSALMAAHMHPQGIKEMAAARGLRIAYAVVSLLGSLEAGQAEDRLLALRTLRDEVLTTATTFYRKNTARVLMQIMKELIRCRDNELRQLKLAHDFRMVSTGRPRLVRSELAKYHLLEMPEEWNQLAFDDRVHDANTKGRKSPTHLAMDAWIKGIRHLTVIYYNFIEPDVAEELLEASELLDISTRIGIEFSARFRGKFIRLTWEPHGFADNQSMLEFIRSQSAQEILHEGHLVSRYQQQYIFAALSAFNDRHRDTLRKDFGLEAAPVDRRQFIRLVGSGQPSLLHLAKYIHDGLLPQIADEMTALRMDYRAADPERRQDLERRAEVLESLDQEAIIRRYLLPACNPEIHDPQIPVDADDIPPLLQSGPAELLARLSALHSGSRFTLNLSNLSIHDTLELLFLCQGRITHIEAYNLKDAAHGLAAQAAASGRDFAGEAVDIINPERSYSLINKLQNALNTDNVISLKRAIRAIIWDFESQRLDLLRRLEKNRKTGQEATPLEQELAAMNERKTILLDILFHLEEFHNFYRKRRLDSRVGTGSTGQSRHQYGMGLVVLDTIPPVARKAAVRDARSGLRKLIPLTASLTGHQHIHCSKNGSQSLLIRTLRRLPGCSRLACTGWSDWTVDAIDIHPGHPGNIATLGGLPSRPQSRLLLQEQHAAERIGQPLTYLNTHLKNTLKVVIGFIPAFLTFSLTKDWWVLAYLGAFIWFGITGVRNVLQSVLGGGGIKRSPLLPWNSLVSWSRIADSLLYTGFSVPLLDYLVKTLLLDRGFAITTATNPLMLYSVMALANGMYIFSHNMFRGLPRTAAVGNLFRSILSIPLAIVFNGLIGWGLNLAMVPGVDQILQKWAAVISKFASDCVAAVIEGMADRQSNIRLRLNGYRTKLSQLFAAFSRLDLLFPEEDVLDLLQSPKTLLAAMDQEARDLEKIFIVNALDLMYFWMYQPRARKALEKIASELTNEEWLILFRSQLILNRQREISQIFVDGLVGKNFAKALSFYLELAETYLRDMEQLNLRLANRRLKQVA